MKDIINKILAEQLELNIEDINSELAQSNTPNWDSLRMLMIVSELESTFELEFEPDEMSKMNSYSGILEVLQRRTA